MMRRGILAALSAAVIGLGLNASASAAEFEAPPLQDWSFSGIFGAYDKASLQRGFQVYREVCAGCHGMKLVAYRNLSALGYSEKEVKAFAAEAEVTDGPNDEGEMFQRPGLPADRFVPPFANDQAARAANNGAFPPDLSVLTKARYKRMGWEGSDYIYAVLTGYHDEPPAEFQEKYRKEQEEKNKGKKDKDKKEIKDFQVSEGMSFNLYFPGYQIAMPPPLADDGVEFADGTKATVDQMAKDVTTFLAWAAEPEMEERKRLGIKVILFLLVMTGLLFALKRKIWADLH
jgi:ubiquinol-cytochrome c reductase cytochrome c1 subunit